MEVRVIFGSRSALKLSLSTKIFNSSFLSHACSRSRAHYPTVYFFFVLSFVSLAAESLGMCMVLSSGANTSMEEVAGACHGLRWFQTHLYKDRSTTEHHVKTAQRAGYKAVLLTLDQPVHGDRLNDERNGFDLPKPLTFPNFNKTFEEIRNFLDNKLDWEDVSWLKSITSLPIILKGILTAEDAKKAVDVGADGILVSNHGGRQLDGAPATVSE